jgi:hypothetical protein
MVSMKTSQELRDFFCDGLKKYCGGTLSSWSISGSEWLRMCGKVDNVAVQNALKCYLARRFQKYTDWWLQKEGQVVFNIKAANAICDHPVECAPFVDDRIVGIRNSILKRHSSSPSVSSTSSSSSSSSAQADPNLLLIVNEMKEQRKAEAATNQLFLKTFVDSAEQQRKKADEESKKAEEERKAASIALERQQKEAAEERRAFLDTLRHLVQPSAQAMPPPPAAEGEEEDPYVFVPEAEPEPYCGSMRRTRPGISLFLICDNN